jgi:hypothetical protein
MYIARRLRQVYFYPCTKQEQDTTQAAICGYGCWPVQDVQDICLCKP